MNSLKKETENPYYSFSRYLKERYGRKVYRVAIDAGFSCPNRGNDRRNPGCTFCDEDGSRAPYLGDEENIKEQIERSIKFLKARYKVNDFILYFQAFSNTNAPVIKLKRIYDYALSIHPFKELIVSTRPDCITEETAELLESYKSEELDVWVELGLQTSSDITLERVNRGHFVKDFINAFNICRNRKLKITVHLIFGLPGEGLSEILNTIRLMSEIKPEGIKIHNLNIVKGTELFKNYLKGEITVPGSSTHLEYLIRALELLPPDIVIMRTVCDTVKSRLAAPGNFWDKPVFLKKLRDEMIKRNTWQGRLFN
jgi:uncharacterized protein